MLGAKGLWLGLFAFPGARDLSASGTEVQSIMRDVLLIWSLHALSATGSAMAAARVLYPTGTPSSNLMPPRPTRRTRALLQRFGQKEHWLVGRTWTPLHWKQARGTGISRLRLERAGPGQRDREQRSIARQSLRRIEDLQSSVTVQLREAWATTAAAGSPR